MSKLDNIRAALQLIEDAAALLAAYEEWSAEVWEAEIAVRRKLEDEENKLQPGRE